MFLRFKVTSTSKKKQEARWFFGDLLQNDVARIHPSAQQLNGTSCTWSIRGCQALPVRDCDTMKEIQRQKSKSVEGRRCTLEFDSSAELNQTAAAY
jgi:hypothetical protein